MNRHDRRASQKQNRKLSRDASNTEIFPAGHGPIQGHLTETMTGVVDVLRKHLGDNYGITLFVYENDAPGDGERLPRFNYISTSERADMVRVLEAFIEKNKLDGAKVDKISNEPPTGSKQ